MSVSTDQFMADLEERYAHQTEFLQAVREVLNDISPLIEKEKKYQDFRVIDRLAEPDRIISFRVTWQDDEGRIRVNRGWRVQQSNLIGPYKGGIRFDSSVTQSVLKFLAFEQCFKNALTGLPMGGAKGGADFSPKGCSDREVMAFCQAFMNELQRHIGPNTDVPAGDINVGSREIGFLYGQYKKIHNQFDGAMTGKEIEFGGSHVRTQATGYGLIYFVEAMLARIEEHLRDKRVVISGAGNVATYTAQKAIEKGAKVLSLSNSKGALHRDDGLHGDDIEWLIEQKHCSDNALKELAEKGRGDWCEGEKPWGLKCDIALPCATQNELAEEDAQSLITNNCRWLCEGANMPCTPEATRLLRESDIVYVPGKASNAGGVALSGLEMTQNAMFKRCDFDVLDQQLKEIMSTIHTRCVEFGKSEDNHVNYAKGASQAGFKRLADAMIALGV